MTLKLDNYNWDCAYVNGFPVLPGGLDIVIRRTPAAQACMFWAEELWLDGCLRFAPGVDRPRLLRIWVTVLYRPKSTRKTCVCARLKANWHLEDRASTLIRQWGDRVYKNLDDITSVWITLGDRVLCPPTGSRSEAVNRPCCNWSLPKWFIEATFRQSRSELAHSFMCLWIEFWRPMRTVLFERCSFSA